MAVALANTPPTPNVVDANWTSFESGFSALCVSAQTITATDNTAAFTLPYMNANGKVKMVLNISAISGASAGLAVNYFESADGANYNTTAALTIASQTATGNYWSAAATAPVFNQGRLSFTVVGTTPSITFSLWILGWNR